MSDYGFVMLAFACLFILQAYRTINPTLGDKESNLNTVGATAQFMIDLALNPSHCAALYGTSLQQRLTQMRETMDKRGETSSRDIAREYPAPVLNTSSPAPQDSVFDQFEELMSIDQYFLNAPWDPSALFSEFLQDTGDIRYI